MEERSPMMKNRLSEDLENIEGAMIDMDCYAVEIWQNRIIRVMLHAISTLLVWAIRRDEHE